MFEQPFHTGDDYYDIEAAIRVGHVDYARERLRDAIQINPDAEVWYLTALVAFSLEERIVLLEKALKLNPSHERARHMLDQTRAIYKTTPETGTTMIDRVRRLFRWNNHTA